MSYALSQLSEQVTTARANMHAVRIVGGNTKAFYGNPIEGEQPVTELEMAGLSGVVSYEPSELVITALAGTRLADIEAVLAKEGQMLAFDPPSFGATSTIGGVVASGLSGPLSFGYGAARHFVLGAHLLDAQGRILKFGGEVMKNVAGYDVSRLLAGSLGMFGVIVQVSLKVMPVAKCDMTLHFEMSEAQALDFCAGLRAKAMPIRAAAWQTEPDGHAGELAVRLCGADSAVQHAAQALGGQTMAADLAHDWWRGLRDQQSLAFAARPLWRLAVAAQTPQLGLPSCAFDMGGEVRWLVAPHADAPEVREMARQAGGHATLFRAAPDDAWPADGVFEPLAAPNRAIVQRLKREFDPMAIFNPGRLVAGI